MNNVEGSNEQKRFYYRLRPMCGNTLDELQNHYLWFSKRQGFKDKYDANIGAFLEDTIQIYNGLKYHFKEEINEFVKQMDEIGICCFTKSLPKRKLLHKYPNGKHSICVKYDVNLLEEWFLNHYGIYKPFKDIEYSECPTKIETNGEYHILIEETKDGRIYESVRTLVHSRRGFERLIILLLTRLKSEYLIQNETRIILGGFHLEDLKTSEQGYKITIPSEAITRIFVYKDLADSSIYLPQLLEIPSISNKIKVI